MAGVLFALLFGATLILIRVKMSEGVGGSAEWLDSQRASISIGDEADAVRRYHLPVVHRRRAGQPRALRGSVLRIGAFRQRSAVFGDDVRLDAVAAALVATNAGVTDPAAHVEVITFGKMVVVSAAKTYAIRMAAVSMISLATIWLKTGLMPRWLVAVSYLVALGLLIAGDVSMWLTLAFPVWVLVVSALILLRAGYIDEQRAALE